MAAKKKTKKKRAKRYGPSKRKPRVPLEWSFFEGAQDPPYYRGDDPREPADVGDIIYLQGRFLNLERAIAQIELGTVCSHDWLAKVNDNVDVFNQAHHETRQKVELWLGELNELREDMVRLQIKMDTLLSMGIIADAVTQHRDEIRDRENNELRRRGLDPRDDENRLN